MVVNVMGKIHRVSPVGPGIFSLGNKGLDVLVGLEEDIGGEVDIDGLFAHVLDLVQVGLHGAGARTQRRRIRVAARRAR